MCVFGFNVAFNNFSVISGLSGGDRELNAHFYSAASLKYHAPDIWHDTTPSHIILSLGRPVLALPRKSWVPSEEQLVPFFTTLVCRGLGSNPWPPVPRSGHSANWAIGAGMSPRKDHMYGLHCFLEEQSDQGLRCYKKSSLIKVYTVSKSSSLIRVYTVSKRSSLIRVYTVSKRSSLMRVYTVSKRSSLIRIYTVYHFVCMFRISSSIWKPYFSNFRIITAMFEFLGYLWYGPNIVFLAIIHERVPWYKIGWRAAIAVKTSLTFKCLIEHLFADFSYSWPLDTYLWKQMMKMNRKLTYKWCDIARKHLLFTKRKCHKFSWLFTASRSPRRRSICACRIAYKVLVSIGL